MERKPVILILTSTDEYGDVSERIADAVRSLGTHNAVVVNQTRYDGYVRNSAFYRWLRKYLSKYHVKAEKIKTRLSGLSRRSDKVRGRSRRIANAVKRYNPEFVLTVTPYALAALADARAKIGTDCKTVHVINAFTYDKHDFPADVAEGYIVENSDVKDALVEAGADARHTMVMGLPYRVRTLTADERAVQREAKSLPQSPTVFLNATEAENAEELLALLIDQGKLINTVCYADTTKLMAKLRRRADVASERNSVAIISRREQIDEFLSVSDVVITHYDPSVIYKSMQLGKPVIAFSDFERGKRDLEYLRERGLIKCADKSIDTVGLLYDFLQADTAAQYAERELARTQMYSVENLANYLTAPELN